MAKTKKSEEQKELEKRRKKMARMERLVFPGEYPGEVLYISKSTYEAFSKKVNITGMRPVGGIGGKVVIEYKPKKGNGSGTLELYDLGPSTK
jgi:hypothetical protein